MEVRIALTNEQRTFLTDVMNAHVSGNRYCSHTMIVGDAIQYGYYDEYHRKFLNDIADMWRNLGNTKRPNSNNK